MSTFGSWLMFAGVILVAVGVYIWAVGRDWERRAEQMRRDAEWSVPNWSLPTRRGPYDHEAGGDFRG